MVPSPPYWFKSHFCWLNHLNPSWYIHIQNLGVHGKNNVFNTSQSSNLRMFHDLTSILYTKVHIHSINLNGFHRFFPQPSKFQSFKTVVENFQQQLSFPPNKEKNKNVSDRFFIAHPSTAMRRIVGRLGGDVLRKPHVVMGEAPTILGHHVVMEVS